MQDQPLSRRSLFKAATAAGIAATASPAQSTARRQSPNVLLILADDLGAGDLSSFGAKDLETPNIDALVSAGMRFDNFYANSPVCSPTRAALLSGRYSDLVGVPGLVRTHPNENFGYLSSEAVLLPQTLRKAGYHSGIIGKWNLGLESPNLPTERGFDFFHGFLGDMMDDYYNHLRHGINYMRRNTEPVEPKGHATDIFTDWAIDYLKERKTDNRKFFLYLPYNAPHVPIQPPPEWLNKVKQRQPDLDPKRAKIVALIEHLDISVGRVVQGLKDNGQWDNTMVIFTSDNGGQSSVGAYNGPWRGGKEDMYEGGIRVPMCAVWSGHIKPGSRCAEPALCMDLHPTACEAAGIPAPEGLNGASLLPLLTGSADRLPARDLIWLRREGGMRYQGQDYYAYRRGDWKLLANSPFEPYRLYNLKDDPEEKTDIAAQQPQIHRDLTLALMGHLQLAGQVPWEKPRGGRGIPGAST